MKGVKDVSENELKLIDNAINGDINSFEILIKKHQKFAYNVALKYLKDPIDAEDATQESLIKAFRYLKSFNKNSKFSTWLYRIVINTCKDELRKNKKDQNNYSLNNDENYIDAIEDESYEPLKNAENSELGKNLHTAIEQLEVTYKDVIILCDMKDYSYQEISEVLEIPIGTVRSRISRGRKKLRKIINEMELFTQMNV
jgi:RNA polymerase sigma-70 factor (ECF subfamily)